MKSSKNIFSRLLAFILAAALLLSDQTILYAAEAGALLNAAADGESSGNTTDSEGMGGDGETVSGGEETTSGDSTTTEEGFPSGNVNPSGSESDSGAGSSSAIRRQRKGKHRQMMLKHRRWDYDPRRHAIDTETVSDGQSSTERNLPPTARLKIALNYPRVMKYRLKARPLLRLQIRSRIRRHLPAKSRHQ